MQREPARYIQLLYLMTCYTNLMQATLDAYEAMEEIWSRTYTGGSRNHHGCQDRAIAVLQDVDKRGWSAVRIGVVEGISEAQALLKDAKDLATLVESFHGPCTTYLQTECSCLLSTSRLYLAAEEEIMSLMDIDPGALDAALLSDSLVWQHS